MVPQSNLIALVIFQFGWMFLFNFFSPIFLLHATKKLDNFFTIVCRTESLRQTEFWFVALSHYNKQNVYLSQRVTATKKISICYQKVKQKTKKKVPKSGKERSKAPKSCCYFWHFFWQHMLILFVAVTQCDKHFYLFVAVIQCNKQNVCMSQ